MSVLKGVFYFAHLSEDISINPMDSVALPLHKYPIIEDEEVDILTKYEQIKFYNSCFQRTSRKGKLRYRVGPALALLMTTGMHSGELLSLTLDDIDIASKEITINKTLTRIRNRNKTKDSNLAYLYNVNEPKTPSGNRIIPLNEWALHAINVLKNEVYIDNKLKLLFSTKSGEYYKPRVLATSFDNILASCNISHKNLHCLRHSFASQMLRENFDIVILSKILGHSNPLTTHNIYIHFLENDKENAVKLLEI